jgi:23S rRNA (pseudouridine1915-N3)-methyltransferase
VKIILGYIGKPRDAHANAMADEYIKRSGRFANCEMREIRPSRFDPWAQLPSATKILLDPAGKALDSAGFTGIVEKAQTGGRDLVFLIGGAEGLPEMWKQQAGMLLALSPMTMPHELARVVLAEQIYRALTTLRGHPYPR